MPPRPSAAARAGLSYDTLIAPFASTSVPPELSQPSPSSTPLTSQSRPPIPAFRSTGSSQALGTRSRALLNPQGRPYWVPSRKDWDNDATLDSPCSYELLLQWMEFPGNWALFKGGARGSSQTKGAKMCEEWLKSHYCPTQRGWAACQTKMNKIHATWGQVDDWLSNTGNGDGGKAIQDASEADRDRVTQDVMAECEAKCPHFERLRSIFAEGDGGTRAYRGDTIHENNPVLAAFQTPSRGTPAWPTDEEDVEEDLEDDREDEEDREETGIQVNPSQSRGRGGSRASSRSQGSRASGSINDIHHGRRRRHDHAFETEMASLVSKEDEYRGKRLKQSESAEESTRRYREEKLRLERERLEEEKKQRGREMALKVAEARCRRDPALDFDLALEEAERRYQVHE